MFGKVKNREGYYEFSKDLYEHEIFSYGTITNIKDDYDWADAKHKGYADFDLEI